ncbi:MAG: hypothetical protein KGZ44_03030 [Dethiobacter sp.]|nr:hypothetical protein [Dethiobacter sp.]
MTIMLKKFLFGMYVFLFIFNPNIFFNLNISIFLFLIALFSFLFFSKEYQLLVKNKNLFTYIFFLLYIIFYLILLSVLVGSDAFLMAYTYLLVIFSLVCSFFIVVIYGRLYKLSFVSFLMFLISIGFVQLIFVFFTIITPEFREFLLTTSRDENLWIISNYSGGLRSFGLANGYTSTFPMLMGVYALIAILMALNKHFLNLNFYWLFALSILFLISVILNARIGLVPIFIFILSIIFFMVCSVKYLVSGLKFLILCGILFVLTLLINLDVYKYTVRLTWAAEEIAALISGDKVGTFLVLGNMFHFPDNTFALIFGTGLSVFGDQNNFTFSSDIGFVRDIYMFGIFNTLLLIFVIIYLTSPLRKYLNDYFGVIATFSLFVALISYYFKGATWSSSEIYNFIVLLSVFSVYLKTEVWKTCKAAPDGMTTESLKLKTTSFETKLA